MKMRALAILLAASISMPASAEFPVAQTRPLAAAKDYCSKPFIDDQSNELMIAPGSYYQNLRFGDLSEMHRQANSENCKLTDGRPLVSPMFNALTRFIAAYKDWDRNLDRIAKFRKAMPNDPLGPILEAGYWEAYAWDARGHGYASSVTEDGWKLFRGRLEKAKKVLEDSKSYASSSPLWYSVMLGVESALGAPQRKQDAVLVEGSNKFPWYIPLYLSRAEYLAPWWGGDWDSVENLARWSVKQSQATMGNAMYARVYWAISHAESVKNLFKDTKASWPTMKSGFDDMMRQFPESTRNLNAYARFACDAGDRKTYLKLRKSLVGEVLDDSVWGSKHHEVCDAKFGYKL